MVSYNSSITVYRPLYNLTNQGLFFHCSIGWVVLGEFCDPKHLEVYCLPPVCKVHYHVTPSTLLQENKKKYTKHKHTHKKTEHQWINIWNWELQATNKYQFMACEIIPIVYDSAWLLMNMFSSIFPRPNIPTGSFALGGQLGGRWYRMQHSDHQDE